MANKVIKLDDLDGKEYDPTTDAGETMTYVWDGVPYEIDLRTENAARFREAMARYVTASRRAENPPAARVAAGRTGSDGRRRGGGQGMGMPKEKLDEIRRWARENGYTVSDSGLIPKRVMEAWQRRDLIPAIPATAAASVRPQGKAPAVPAAAGDKSPGSVSDEPAKPQERKQEPVTAVRPPSFSGRGSDSR